MNSPIRSVVLGSAVVATASLGLASTPAAAQQVVISGTGVLHTAPAFPVGLAPGAFSFFTTVLQSPGPLPDVPPTPVPPPFTLPGLTTVTFVQGSVTTVIRGAFSAYPAAGRGGIRFSVPGIDYLWATGPQVFTGSLTAPTFIVGEYVATGSASSLSTVTRFTITSATTVVPEPSTWALLGTGFLGLGAGVARRRRPTPT